MKTIRKGFVLFASAFLLTAAWVQNPRAATEPDKSEVTTGAPSPAAARKPVPGFPYSYALPGQFAFKTTRSYYLTAISGGGRFTEPTIISASMSAGPWEQFQIVVNPANPYDKSFQVMTGNYVTAVNGGGMTSDALHTDATLINRWEQFRMIDLSEGGFAPTWYSLYTIGGKSVTAVGAGGHYQDAIHTDATQVGSWEEFRPVKCGDLGSGYNYYILPVAGGMLTAPDGGGHADDGAIVQGSWFGEPDNLQWSRFKLLRQADGSYAMQTSNGTNFVTALGGGGQVSVYEPCPFEWYGACISGESGIFHTDATKVLGWEKFRIIDQGNCKYAIQTVKGFFFGTYQTSNGTFFTTDRSAITDRETFEFVMSDLGSPPIFH